MLYIAHACRSPSRTRHSSCSSASRRASLLPVDPVVTGCSFRRSCSLARAAAMIPTATRAGPSSVRDSSRSGKSTRWKGSCLGTSASKSMSPMRTLHTLSHCSTRASSKMPSPPHLPPPLPNRQQQSSPLPPPSLLPHKKQHRQSSLPSEHLPHRRHHPQHNGDTASSRLQQPTRRLPPSSGHTARHSTVPATYPQQAPYRHSTAVHPSPDTHPRTCPRIHPIMPPLIRVMPPASGTLQQLALPRRPTPRPAWRAALPCSMSVPRALSHSTITPWAYGNDRDRTIPCRRTLLPSTTATVPSHPTVRTLLRTSLQLLLVHRQRQCTRTFICRHQAPHHAPRCASQSAAAHPSLLRLARASLADTASADRPLRPSRVAVRRRTPIRRLLIMQRMTVARRRRASRLCAPMLMSQSGDSRSISISTNSSSSNTTTRQCSSNSSDTKLQRLWLHDSSMMSLSMVASLTLLQLLWLITRRSGLRKLQSFGFFLGTHCRRNHLAYHSSRLLQLRLASSLFIIRSIARRHRFNCPPSTYSRVTVQLACNKNPANLLLFLSFNQLTTSSFTRQSVTVGSQLQTFFSS